MAAEYGAAAGSAPKDTVVAISAILRRQRLSPPVQAAALTAIFKLAAGVHNLNDAAALAAPLKALLAEKEGARDMAISRLAAMTNTCLACVSLLSTLPFVWPQSGHDAWCCIVVAARRQLAGDLRTLRLAATPHM